MLSFERLLSSVTFAPDDGGGLRSADQLLKRQPETRFLSDPFEIKKKDARDQFAQVVEEAHKQNNFIVTSHGKPQAAIIGVEKYRILDYLEAIGLTEELGKVAAMNLTKEEFKERLRSICEGP